MGKSIRNGGPCALRGLCYTNALWGFRGAARRADADNGLANQHAAGSATALAAPPTRPRVARAFPVMSAPLAS